MEKPKVVHFSEDFTLENILDYLKDKNDILYYTRTLNDNKEFHIIKYNENAFFEIDKLQSGLFDFYKKNKTILPFLKKLKTRGNSNFIIIENINLDFINKLKNDLNNVLKK